MSARVGCCRSVLDDRPVGTPDRSELKPAEGTDERQLCPKLCGQTLSGTDERVSAALYAAGPFSRPTHADAVVGSPW